MGAPVSWTLIDIPWNYTAPFAATLHKNYWVMKQFTGGIPPGSFPIDISPVGGCHHSVSAFYVPWRRQIVVLLVNQQDAPYDLPLTLTHFRAVSAPYSGDNTTNSTNVNLRVFRTSYPENAALVLNRTLPLPPRISVRLERLSLTSLVISNVVPV